MTKLEILNKLEIITNSESISKQALLLLMLEISLDILNERISQ